ncbi:TetR/AcrR family transcriptional regulator [Geofilum sp. OHC36d9]|uniref:TetR/AcrR family transcriptional regulator n=1 Tax=Geofilum sp. OHC36d9 TaxID=3458413 RepID=UPI004033D8A2
MAKAIDEEKLKRIKEAAIELIVKNGYGGASISAIASRADVATGYLYRFYPGKYELVSDLLNNKVHDIADEIEKMYLAHTTVAQVSRRLIDYFFQQAAEFPFHIRFLYILIAEYKFTIGNNERNMILTLCRQIMNTGHSSGEINEKFREEELFLMLVIYPIEYINLRFKGFITSQSLAESDKNRVHQLCVNALK